jgi:hypothetical protein
MASALVRGRDRARRLAIVTLAAVEKVDSQYAEWRSC